MVGGGRGLEQVNPARAVRGPNTSEPRLAPQKLEIFTEEGGRLLLPPWRLSGSEADPVHRLQHGCSDRLALGGCDVGVAPDRLRAVIGGNFHKCKIGDLADGDTHSAMAEAMEEVLVLVELHLADTTLKPGQKIRLDEDSPLTVRRVTDGEHENVVIRVHRYATHVFQPTQGCDGTKWTSHFFM